MPPAFRAAQFNSSLHWVDKVFDRFSFDVIFKEPVNTTDDCGLAYDARDGFPLDLRDPKEILNGIQVWTITWIIVDKGYSILPHPGLSLE